MAICKECSKHLNIQGFKDDESCICLECRVKMSKNYEHIDFKKQYDMKFYPILDKTRGLEK